jgi:hypothetical protein
MPVSIRQYPQEVVKAAQTLNGGEKEGGVRNTAYFIPLNVCIGGGQRLCAKRSKVINILSLIIKPAQRRYNMRHEMLTQRNPFCHHVNTKKSSIS